MPFRESPSSIETRSLLNAQSLTKPHKALILLICFLTFVPASAQLPPPPGGPGGVQQALQCASVIPGSMHRKGTCIGSPACISRLGIIVNIPLPIIYLNADNFQELAYDDCLPLQHVANPSCWENWGFTTTCLTFDCYSSWGFLGPVCTVGSMVGTDYVTTDQCW
jgi:hypothetical protein